VRFRHDASAVMRVEQRWLSCAAGTPPSLAACARGVLDPSGKPQKRSFRRQGESSSST